MFHPSPTSWAKSLVYHFENFRMNKDRFAPLFWQVTKQLTPIWGEQAQALEDDHLSCLVCFFSTHRLSLISILLSPQSPNSPPFPPPSFTPPQPQMQVSKNSPSLASPLCHPSLWPPAPSPSSLSSSSLYLPVRSDQRLFVSAGRGQRLHTVFVDGLLLGPVVAAARERKTEKHDCKYRLPCRHLKSICDEIID